MEYYPNHAKLDLVQIAKVIGTRWEEEQTFLKSLQQGKKKFHFYEGPPGANGKPGVHHLLARTLKDLCCRYKTMQGYAVERKILEEIEFENERG